MKFKLAVACSFFLCVNASAQKSKSPKSLVLDVYQRKPLSIISKDTISIYKENVKRNFKYPIILSCPLVSYEIFGIDFIDDTYNNIVNFNGACFNDRTCFTSAQFNDTSNFSQSIFKEPTYFVRARFNSDANFSNAIFYKEAGFGVAKFNKTANFSYAEFNNADFSDASFTKDVNFNSANFNRIISFSSTEFKAKCDFTYASFNQSLELSNIKQDENTSFNFTYTRLPQLFDFSENPVLHHKVDLTRSHRRRRAGDSLTYINLYNTDIANVRIEYQHFRLCFYTWETLREPQSFDRTYEENGEKKKINDSDTASLVKHALNADGMKDYLKQIFPSAKLSDPVINQFMLTCFSRRALPGPLSRDQTQAIYEQLLKNFKDNGQNDSYEALDIEYKDFKNGAFILPHIWNLYGYRREWVFYWALAFLAFFTLTTTLFIRKLNKPTADDGVYHMENLKLKDKAPWYNRLWCAFMYTATLFFILKVDVGKLNFDKKAGVFYIIIIYSTGVLCLGYMANFVLQK